MSKIKTFFVNGAKRWIPTGLSCRRRAERRYGTFVSGTPVPALQGDRRIRGEKNGCGKILLLSSKRRTRTSNSVVVVAREGSVICSLIVR